MLDSGSGLTFTDDDLKQIRVIIGLLGRATSFKNIDAAGMLEGTQAIKWAEQLVGKIRDNIFDMSTAKMTQPAGE